MEVLPSEGSGVVVVAITKGRPLFLADLVVSARHRGRIRTNGNDVISRQDKPGLTRQSACDSKNRTRERTRIAQRTARHTFAGFPERSMNSRGKRNQRRTMHRPSEVNRVLDMMGSGIQEGRNTVQGLPVIGLGFQRIGSSIFADSAELAATKSAVRVMLEE